MTRQPDTTPVAELRHASKTYRRRLSRRERRRHAQRLGAADHPVVERVALRNCSLRVLPGETLAVLGPNGAGKSTLVKLLLGQLAPDRGDVKLFDQPAHQHHAIAQGRVGVAFQEPGLDALLTARENLELQGRLFGMRRDHIDRRIAETTASLGVADRLDDRVATLSGGLRRRVDLARALLTQPDLLILDEPAAGLDIAARRDTARIIAERRCIAPTAALLVTTHHVEIADVADRLVMLRHGAVAADGRIDALRAQLLGDQHAALVLHLDDPAALDQLLTPDRRDQVRITPDPRGGAIVGAPHHTLANLATDLAKHAATFALRTPTIEELYLAFTGATLDDAHPHTDDDDAHAHAEAEERAT